MATLTETTWMIRKGLVWGSIGSVVLTILGFGVWFGIKSIATEPPVPTPTPGLAFGALPSVEFPDSGTRPKSFELLLIEGDPPPARYSNVYFVPKKAATLFSRKNAAELAVQLGFSQEPVITDTTLYDYADPQSKNTLSIDIPYKFYTFKAGSVEPSSYLANIPEDESKLKAAAEGYLRSISLWNEDLTQMNVTYVEWTGSGFIPSAQNRKTRFARIDLFNPAHQEVPIITSDPREGNAYVIFGFTKPTERIMVGSKYKYYAPDFNIGSTYPTISGTAAWELLQDGNGFIANPLTTGTKASIRRMYLAYYQPDTFQDYLQPVWVFEGDQDFVAMIYAIDPQYVSEN